MAASANFESVFSGAGKFCEEAPSTGPILLQRMAKLHDIDNWKYPFLRPTMHKVIEPYNQNFRPKVAAAAAGIAAAAPAGPSDARPNWPELALAKLADGPN